MGLFWDFGTLIRTFENIIQRFLSCLTLEKVFYLAVFFGKPDDQHPISVLHTVRADAGMIHLLFQDMLHIEIWIERRIFLCPNVVKEKKLLPKFE